MYKKYMYKTFKFILIFFLIISMLYSWIVFFDIPGIKDLRNIWIETAMTTADHQWLATKIFPEYLIKKVMKDKINIDDISITDIDNTQSIYYKKPSLLLSTNPPEILNNKKFEDFRPKDILNQKNLKEYDEFGNKIIVNDIEQGIVIIEVKDLEYTGYLTLIDDPSRVFVGVTQKKERGQTTLEYFDEYDIVVAMNANGFGDAGGVGKGNVLLGCTRSEGKDICNGNKDFYITAGFNDKDQLVIGRMKDWDKYNLRDAVQYEPILILNGEKVIDGSGGWGLQPRTIVAQRKDGVVMFLAIDGRKPGYSLGATMGTCADILLQYGAENATAMDGGSSTTLAYNKKLVNKPSTPMTTGRYLPNALMVRKK